MKRLSFGSLRLRLIILVLIATIPALGINLHSGFEQRKHVRQTALDEARRLAQDFSATHDRLILNARQILFTLSKTSEVQQQDKAACSKLFADIMKQSEGYTALVGTKPNGDLFASSKPITSPINFSDRPWFQRVLKTRDFVIGEYLIGRVSGKPIIVLAHPVFDGIGNLKALLNWGMDLEWLNNTVAKSKFQEGTSVIVIDSGGAILFRYPEPEKFVGKSMPEAPIVKAILAKREGVEEEIGLNGLRSLYGFTSLGKGIESIHLVVGIPKQVALARADRVVKQNLAYLGLIAFLALAAAWFMGGFFIIHPVNRLLETTKRIEEGDLTARAGPSYGNGEIGQLAYAFDQMAESLKKREAELSRAVESLKVSEERFRTIFNDAMDGILLADTEEKRFHTGNKSICQMLGYTLEEIKNMGIMDIHPKEDLPYVVEQFGKQSMKEITLAKDIPVLRKDGTIFYADVNSSVVSMAEKTYMLGIFRDITERRQAEEALKEQVSFLQQLIDALPNPLFYKNVQGIYGGCNTAFEKYLGLSQDQIVGKTVYDIAPKDLADFYDRQDKKLFNNPGTQSYEASVLYADDSRHDVLFSKATYTDTDGRLAGLVGVMVDITERKRGEQERVRLASAIEQAAESVVITDTNAIVQYVNPAFEQITGFSRDETIGQNPRILKSGKHNASFYESLWNILTSGNTWTGRFINKKKDGTLFTEEASISPVMNAEGNITNYVAVKRDITNEIIREEQLRRAQRMEAIGTLAGGIAHDFNNILSAVIGYGELAMDDVPEGAILKNKLQEILNAGYRARDLVKQILAFSRQTEQEVKPISMKHIAKEALKLLRASLPSTITIQDGIRSDGTMLGDPTQIHQVIMNLCTNAAYAMREKGGILELSLSDEEIGSDFPTHKQTLPPGRYVKLRVSDTGSGIPPDIIGKIFDPFFTTKGEAEGTGLGLSMVHGIVKSLYGAINVSSEQHEGSTFEIYFPAIVTEMKEETLIQRILPKGTEHILFVDDEKPIADIVKRILVRQGYSVSIRTSSIEALELFKVRSGDYDLVITDLTMPNMTGLELSKEINNIRPDIPIILCSGFADQVSEKRLNEHGIATIVKKPIPRNELVQTVRQVLDREFD